MPEKARTADEPEHSGQDLHIPTRKLAPPAKPSLPLTAPIKQQSDLSRRLDANQAVRFWRGQYVLLPGLLLGGFAMFLWTLAAWALFFWTIDPSNYSGNYVFKQWLVIALVLALPGGVIWWRVGVSGGPKARLNGF